MSPPTPFHPKIEPNNGLYDSSPLSPPLKINKESYIIKKSSSSSWQGAAAIAPVKPHQQQQQQQQQQQHRQPVIIYTHSPKIIHTHPHDFMALVQKLTGYTRSEDDPPPQPSGNTNGSPNGSDRGGNGNIRGVNCNEDYESMNSGLTDENGSCLNDPQLNSCFMPPPMFDHRHHSAPCFNTIPFFAPSTTDFLCSSTTTTTTTSQSFYNLTDPLMDSLYFMPGNIRRSMSSSASLEGLKDYQDM